MPGNEHINYVRIAKNIGVHKFMGQNFLINRDIAAAEAKYANGLQVVEIGPGLGILTRELCRTAKSVVAVEKDNRLFGILESELHSKKLRLINGDFFSIDPKELGKIDIMVSNIPYNLSSKTVYWIGKMGIPALICIQKEFADHMTAKAGTRDYSRLSVMSSLLFRVHQIKDVPRGDFYPMPKVDSCIVYLSPLNTNINEKVSHVISLMMIHKKKRLRNALVDSSKELGISKQQARLIAENTGHSDSRPFQLEPSAILDIARDVLKSISAQKA